MKILGTGLSGMVGTTLVKLLKDKYTFQDLSLEKGVDIRDKNQVFKRIKNSKAEIVIHMAAVTDVDFCEKEKKLKEKSLAWQVNVEGTRNIAKACKKHSKRLIYISTDFVFDGYKKGLYLEDDLPNPINFYGQTKFLGEKIVQKLDFGALICRLAFPYGTKSVQKKDFVQIIVDKLKKKKKVLGVIDQTFTPTLISDIVKVIDKLFKINASGIYHLVGSEALSPYKTVLEIVKIFGFNKELIKKTTMNEFYKEKAKRPKNLALSNKKISKLTGVKIKTFKRGLKEISNY